MTSKSTLPPEPLLPLIVAVSTRALFDLEEEHDVFVGRGEEAYCQLQRQRENLPLEPGCAFDLTRRLFALNPTEGKKLVDVVLISKNAPDLALRAFHSCEHYSLPVKNGSFTSGRSVAPYVAAWGADLFLSNDDHDVRAVLSAGTAAALLGPAPAGAMQMVGDEVHFALDGDAVLFNSESDRIFEEHGLGHFELHERTNAEIPMAPGPFGGALLRKLAWLRKTCLRVDGASRVRVSLVTARSAPAHERAIRTLRAWQTPVDEVHFVGDSEKAPFLSAANAHIFFDDRERHVSGASVVVPAGLVPSQSAPV
jgi:5'-nucleotidase